MSEQPSSEYAIPMIDFTDPQFYQSELTEDEIALRNLYVLELLKDYDWRAAAVRVGFHAAFIDNWVQVAQADAYIQRRLSDLKTVKPDIPEQSQLDLDKNLVLNTLREATQQGPYNTRVAAAARLAQIQGFDKSEDAGVAREVEMIQVLKEFAQKVK